MGDDDDDKGEQAMHLQKYNVMPSLVSLQQMRNRMHLALLGKKLMKMTAMATGKELRRLAQEINNILMGYREEVSDAYMALARARYFIDDMNYIVMETMAPKAIITVKATTKSTSGVKTRILNIVEIGVDGYQYLGLSRGGEAVEAARTAWLALLKKMIRICELKAAFHLTYLANKNATKKKNVLQRNIIPRIMITLKYIMSELDEAEREETFRLKRFKQLKNKNKAIPKKKEIEPSPLPPRPFPVAPAPKPRPVQPPPPPPPLPPPAPPPLTPPVPAPLPPPVPALLPAPPPHPLACPCPSCRIPPTPPPQPPPLRELPGICPATRISFRSLLGLPPPPPKEITIVEPPKAQPEKKAEPQKEVAPQKVVGPSPPKESEPLKDQPPELQPPQVVEVPVPPKPVDPLEGLIMHMLKGVELVEEVECAEIPANVSGLTPCDLVRLKSEFCKIIKRRDNPEKHKLDSSCYCAEPKEPLTSADLPEKRGGFVAAQSLMPKTKVQTKIPPYILQPRPQPKASRHEMTSEERLKLLERKVDEVICTTNFYQGEGLLSKDAEDFMKCCRHVKMKINELREQKKLTDKLDALKQQIKKLTKMTDLVESDKTTTTAMSYFKSCCKEFMDKIERRKKCKGAPSVHSIEKLITHIGDSIALSSEAKNKGLLSDSMEKFIESCKEIKSKIQPHVTPTPRVIGELLLNIKDITEFISKYKHDGLMSDSIEDFYQTCLTTKSKLVSYKPPSEAQVDSKSLGTNQSCSSNKTETSGKRSIPERPITKPVCSETCSRKTLEKDSQPPSRGSKPKSTESTCCHKTLKKGSQPSCKDSKPPCKDSKLKCTDSTCIQKSLEKDSRPPCKDSKPKCSESPCAHKTFKKDSQPPCTDSKPKCTESTCTHKTLKKDSHHCCKDSKSISNKSTCKHKNSHQKLQSSHHTKSSHDSKPSHNASTCMVTTCSHSVANQESQSSCKFKPSRDESKCTATISSHSSNVSTCIGKIAKQKQQPCKASNDTKPTCNKPSCKHLQPSHIDTKPKCNASTCVHKNSKQDAQCSSKSPFSRDLKPKYTEYSCIHKLPYKSDSYRASAPEHAKPICSQCTTPQKTGSKCSEQEKSNHHSCDVCPSRSTSIISLKIVPLIKKKQNPEGHKSSSASAPMACPYGKRVGKVTTVRRYKDKDGSVIEETEKVVVKHRIFGPDVIPSRTSSCTTGSYESVQSTKTVNVCEVPVRGFTQTVGNAKSETLIRSHSFSHPYPPFTWTCLSEDTLAFGGGTNGNKTVQEDPFLCDSPTVSDDVSDYNQ